MIERQLFFHGFDSLYWLFYAAVVVAALVMVVMLFQYEQRLIPKRVGHLLLGLRIAVILAVFLSLLEPVIGWTLSRDVLGRILVSVDLSESMTTADKHASKAEKLRWARALGMIGNSKIDARLDKWTTAFENDSEPTWVEESEAADESRRVELAKSRKADLDAVFSEIDKLSRQDIAYKLLTQGSNPLINQLSEIANVQLEVFAGTTQSADAQTLEATIKQPPESLLQGLSAISETLHSATPDEDGSPLLGVVLVTDGRDNSNSDPLAIAQRLGSSSIPVYSIVLGSEILPRDISIASLDYPSTVFKDDLPILTVNLHTSGFADTELEITLAEAGSEPIVKTVTTDSTGATVDFQLNAEKIGRHEYTISSTIKPGEIRKDNNSQTFAMNVVDDKVRVLLVEGEAGWEFRFLDNALTRDPRVEVKKVVFEQPYLGILDDTFFPRQLDLKGNAGEQKTSPFNELSMIIIGDVSAERMPEETWQAIEQFVAETGGTLVLQAGKRHFPHKHHSSTLNQLLPITNFAPINLTGAEQIKSPRNRGFHLQLTPDGEEELMLQFSTNVEENRELWSELPGHLWGLSGQAKPGATVLAETNLAGTSGPTPIIVRQQYGFGQVVWLGIDSTWRWRHRTGDKFHHRFWGQLGRWAADHKAASGNESVRFGPEQTDIEVGQDAIILAQWTQLFLNQNPELTARAEFFRAGKNASTKPITSIDLTPHTGNPLSFSGRAVSLPAGEYRINLVTENAELDASEITATLFINEKKTRELSELLPNLDLLTKIAEVSGGKVFRPDEAQEIPRLFQDPGQTEVSRHEITLWDHWFVMCVFFGLLTTEWVVRKLNGLP